MFYKNKNNFKFDFKKKKIFISCILGSGMSAISFILLDNCFLLYGSDLNFELKNNLYLEGIRIFKIHSIKNLKNVFFFLYSSGINIKNIEFFYFLFNSFFFLNRSYFISLFLNKRTSFIISGSHGKSTSCCILFTYFFYFKNKSGYLSGEYSLKKKKKNNSGSSFIFIYELDESDGNPYFYISFFFFLTNIDLEHLSYIKNNFLNLLIKFSKLIFNLNYLCVFFFNLNSNFVVYLIKNFIFSFRYISDFGFSLINLRNSFCIKKKYFSFFFLNFNFFFFCSKLFGRYNFVNLFLIFSFFFFFYKFFFLFFRFLSFYGIKYRLNFLFRDKINIIINDYAHHPTEITNVFNVINLIYFKFFKIAVFQPHRFSRFYFLIKKFFISFNKKFDIIFFLNIHEINFFFLYNKYLYVLYYFKFFFKSKFFFLNFFLYIFNFYVKKISNKKKNVIIFIGAGNIKDLSFLFLNFFFFFTKNHGFKKN